MKRIFSNFLLSYFSLSASLLIILITISVYFYRLSGSNAHSEGASHLSTQMEILENDLARMSVLISFIGTDDSVIKTAALSKPLAPANLYTMDLARRNIVNAVNALLSDMIADYGIIFQSGLCVTANRIFDSAEDCFGVFLRFPEDSGIWNTPAGFSYSGIFYTPEHRDFPGIIFSGNMRLRYNTHSVNKVFFVINTDILFKKWLNNDIKYVELYNRNMRIGSYGDLSSRETYQKIEYTSPGGYRGIAYIPNSVIWEKIRPVVFFISVCILLFLVTGFGLSIYFSQKQAKPLQKIVSQLTSRSNVSSLPANELLFIMHSVEQMGTDLEKTHSILREQDRILRLGMFERLLAGLIYTTVEWNDVRSMFGDFPEVWCLCLIQGDHQKNETEDSARSAVHLSAQFVRENLNVNIIVHYIGNDGAAMILPVSAESPEPENYGEILTETIELMRTKHQFHIFVAVSGVFSNLEEVSTAFRQTKQLLRLTEKQTGKALFFMGYAEANPDRFPLEFTDSQRFYELLMTADYEHAALMIKHSFEYFHDRGFVQEPVVYHLFWSFEQVFIRVRAENAVDSGFDFSLPVYDPQNTIEELTEKILAASRVICGNIENSNRRREMELSASIMKYIDENIADPMLNLSGLASAFGLSERYTQSIIRNAAVKSFFEYVDQKRMKMAYSLLTESSLSVNDIAVKCGYTLPNSFYKSFKRHFGYPPTDIRKDH